MSNASDDAKMRWALAGEASLIDTTQFSFGQNRTNIKQSNRGGRSSVVPRRSIGTLRDLDGSGFPNLVEPSRSV